MHNEYDRWLVAYTVNIVVETGVRSTFEFYIRYLSWLGSASNSWLPERNAISSCEFEPRAPYVP